jgi:hypothetical protein
MTLFAIIILTFIILISAIINFLHYIACVPIKLIYKLVVEERKVTTKLLSNWTEENCLQCSVYVKEWTILPCIMVVVCSC